MGTTQSSLMVREDTIAPTTMKKKAGDTGEDEGYGDGKYEDVELLITSSSHFR